MFAQSGSKLILRLISCDKEFKSHYVPHYCVLLQNSTNIWVPMDANGKNTHVFALSIATSVVMASVWYKANVIDQMLIFFLLNIDLPKDWNKTVRFAY